MSSFMPPTLPERAILSFWNVLVPIHLHPLPEPQSEPLLVLGHEGLVHVDLVLLQHHHHQLAHGVFDGLRGEHAHAVGLLVQVERDPRQRLQRALVVLRLEAQVLLDVDGDGGGRLARDLPEHRHVLRDERELLGWICEFV